MNTNESPNTPKLAVYADGTTVFEYELAEEFAAMLDEVCAENDLPVWDEVELADIVDGCVADLIERLGKARN